MNMNNNDNVILSSLMICPQRQNRQNLCSEKLRVVSSCVCVYIISVRAFYPINSCSLLFHKVEMWKKMDAMNKKGKGPKKQKLVIEENMTHQVGL